MTLSTAIMAHRDRESLYTPLAKQLGIDTVCVDDGTLGRWGNGRRCLLSYDQSASHHLVIQDDAVPAADLMAGIEAWLPHLPDSILVLYAGRIKAWRRIHAQHSSPPCWLKMNTLQWGVALVVPTAVIPDLVRMGDRLTAMDNYDAKLGEANRKTHKLPILIPSPSWVDHAFTPSMVPGRSPARHALSPHTGSVLDWGTPGEVPIIEVPDFVRQRVAIQASRHHHLRGR